MRPQISVIIVNYNTKSLTLKCVESVIKTSKDLDVEIIIIDNGSNDGCLEAVKETYKAVSNNYKIKTIRNEENLGFAKANNQGIRVSKGKYVLLLNSDTIVLDGAIKKLLDFAKNCDDCGAVVPKLLNKNRSIQGSVFRFPTVTLAIKQYWIGMGNYLDKYVPRRINNERAVEIDSAVMAAYLITPNTLTKVGFLDERYFMFFEDFDYCRRIRNKGLKVYYLFDAEVIHYHGSSGIKLAEKKNQWKRLIPSSKIYHGLVKHYLINLIIRSSQTLTKLRGGNLPK